ncbi:MAG: outer membrane protein [Xanthobacteraceae bacterium]
MKRVLLSISMTAIVSLAVAAGAAFAADMPVRRPLPPQATVKAPPPLLFDWSGFYAGVHGGYGWGRSSFDYPGAPSGSFDADGWLLGGVVGVNYQAGQTVLGLEADLNWTDLSGSTACVTGICQTTNSWLGTVRGRLGYAADRFMPYVTGGVAFGDVEANVPGVGKASDTRVGWTAGVGAEYALSERMSWKTEYLYVDLGKFNCGAACAGPANVDFKAHIVRTGLNLRF